METIAGIGEDLPPWYVTGFVEGEGLFTYSYARRRTNMTVVFAVRLAASDRPLLEAVRGFFGGIGRIYAAPRSPPGRHSGRTKSSCYLKATRPADLLRVVDHLDRYPLRSEKRHVYAVWREMVFVRAAYHGTRAPEELDRLAASLSRSAPRSSRRD